MISYLGIDAGGTYTRCTLFDDHGETIESKSFESLHFMRVGFEGITRVLGEIRSSFLLFEMNDDYEVVLGIAGYGQDPVIRSEIEKAIQKVFPKAVIMSDAQLAMVSALENQEGIFVISGTGSIAFQILDGKIKRSGGWGYLLDDEGSAFDIGRDVLKAFVQMADGRREKTLMYNHILSSFDFNEAYELIAFMNLHKDDYRQQVASFAKLVFPLALQGDLVVRQIYETAGENLAKLVRSFNQEGTIVSYGGSVLLHNSFVRDRFITSLKDKYTIIEPTHTPEYAAVLIGKEKQ